MKPAWANWPAHQSEVPQPEVKELPAAIGWVLWDKAVQDQDSGYMSLEPIKPAVSERSALRAEGVR